MTTLDDLRAQERAEHARASALLKMLPTDPEPLIAMEPQELYAFLVDGEMIANAMLEALQRAEVLAQELDRLEGGRGRARQRCAG